MSPDCKFFANIKKDWANIDSQVCCRILGKDVQGREEALTFYRDLLTKRNKRIGMIVRDDYRELADCAILVLGKTPPSG